jgi:hypothetical protein
VIKSAFTWDVPVGKGKKLLGNAGGVVNALAGGWNSRLPCGTAAEPARPSELAHAAELYNGPGVWANFATPSGGFTSVFNPSTFNPWNASDPGNRMFNTSAFSDAPTQQLGNTPNRFPQVRVPWDLSEDATIQKHFRLREGFNLQLRFEMINVFNRHYFGGPDLNLASVSFGNIRTASGGRIGQLGARLDW